MATKPRPSRFEHVPRMKVAMQQHAHAGVGDEPTRELMAPSDSVDRHRASHRLAPPGVPLHPVLEDEVDPRCERHHAVGDDRRTAAMQLADEVRDLLQLDTFAPLGEWSLARDALRSTAPDAVSWPHTSGTRPEDSRLRSDDDSGTPTPPQASA